MSNEPKFMSCAVESVERPGAMNPAPSAKIVSLLSKSPTITTPSKDRLAAKISPRRDFNMWRYSEFLPLPENYVGPNAVGGTPLVASRKLGNEWGLENLYFKNDAVCFPSLSFKDRVVATALAAARRFGFETVGCSSTGNLANAVAAQAAQQGFDACVFIPADLEPAKVLNTAVYGARIVRIDGNYDHVNRLCAQIADRFRWGLVNVNLRPYYSEGSKTHGLRNRRAVGLETSRQRRRPHGGRLADHQNRQSLPRTRHSRLGRSHAPCASSERKPPAARPFPTA